MVQPTELLFFSTMDRSDSMRLVRSMASLQVRQFGVPDSSVIEDIS